MDNSNSSMARQLSQAASAFEQQASGHAPKTVTVILSDHTLVITLHGSLSLAEMTVVQNSAGAARVQEFYRQLFTNSSYSLREEIKRITGVEVRDITSASIAAQQLRDRSQANVLITLGANGVWLATDSFTGHVPAFKVQAVDSVGAGDTFIGAFAVRVAEGADMPMAARFGCAAAAIAVTRRGAQASQPTRTEVEAFLAANPGLK